MKSRKILMVLLTSVALVAAAGCSPTRTQKSMGEQIDDTVLLTKVKAALIGDEVTKARQIDVEVFRGTVQLNGFVDSAEQKSRATTVTRGVEGVRKVQNNLAVAAGGESVGQVVDDTTITTKVKAALADDAATNAFQINVETKNGVVQLSGFVDNSAGKAAATRVARSVGGVRSVRNEIDVK